MHFCRVLSISLLFFQCKTNAVSLIFTILMIFARVQYRIFRKMTKFRSVRNVSLRFLHVFNCPLRCRSVLIVSLQNTLQISCDFQVFRRFSMKSTNLNTCFHVLTIPSLFFECKIHAFSLIFTILTIFAGVQYRIFRRMTQFWSVRSMSLRFLRVFNFPIRCGSVLSMSLQNSLQISCDFQVFRRFSMKSMNLNTLFSRSNYIIAVFQCKINAFSLIFTILMIFAGVQYRIFRKMTQFWSVRSISLRFLRVFNFPIRCGSVLKMSLQNSLQISCDFQVFRRFSMKSTNLNALLSRSNYIIGVF